METMDHCDLSLAKVDHERGLLCHGKLGMGQIEHQFAYIANLTDNTWTTLPPMTDLLGWQGPCTVVIRDGEMYECNHYCRCIRCSKTFLGLSSWLEQIWIFLEVHQARSAKLITLAKEHFPVLGRTYPRNLNTQTLTPAVQIKKLLAIYVKFGLLMECFVPGRLLSLNGIAYMIGNDPGPRIQYLDWNQGWMDLTNAPSNNANRSVVIIPYRNINWFM